MPPIPAHTATHLADEEILGFGVDLCAAARMPRPAGGDELDIAAAICRPDERRWCAHHPHPDRALASLVAAKESVIKALARARGQGTFWQDIEIDPRDPSRPVVVLHGRLARLAHQLGVRRVLLAWASSREHATACALVTSGSPAAPAADPPSLAPGS